MLLSKVPLPLLATIAQPRAAVITVKESVLGDSYNSTGLLRSTIFRGLTVDFSNTLSPNKGLSESGWANLCVFIAARMSQASHAACWRPFGLGPEFP